MKVCDNFKAKCLTEKATYNTELASMLQISDTLGNNLFLET